MKFVDGQTLKLFLCLLNYSMSSSGNVLWVSVVRGFNLYKIGPAFIKYLSPVILLLGNFAYQGSIYNVVAISIERFLGTKKSFEF